MTYEEWLDAFWEVSCLPDWSYGNIPLASNPYDVLGKPYDQAPAQTEKPKQPTVGQMSKTAYRAMQRGAWGR